MRTTLLLATALAIGAPSAPAHGQAPAHGRASPLADALATRRPPTELVVQVCRSGTSHVQDHVCARGADGTIRASRRVALRGTVASARLGDSVFFTVRDDATETPFAGVAWRWDLVRDEMQALGALGHVDDETAGGMVATTFGVVYRTTAGPMLHDGTSPRPIALPEGFENAQVFVLDGTTYGTWSMEHAMELRALTLHGDRVQWELVARLPGFAAVRRGAVIASREPHPHATDFHLLVLPGRAIVDATVPLRDDGSLLRSDGRALRVWNRASAFEIDVTTGALGRIGRGEIVLPGPLDITRPRALVWVVAGHAEVWLRAGASRGVALGTAGVSVRRRGPAPRTTCRCHGDELVCGRSGPTVAGACAAVGGTAEIVHQDDAHRPRAEPAFTGDGRFRVDQVEPDLARITRLADGARLWARLFDDVTLLAQRDDGTYFLGDRALETRIVLREGPALLDASVTPLTSRPDLFRATLVEDFFAGN